MTIQEIKYHIKNNSKKYIVGTGLLVVGTYYYFNPLFKDSENETNNFRTPPGFMIVGKPQDYDNNRVTDFAVKNVRTGEYDVCFGFFNKYTGFPDFIPYQTELNEKKNLKARLNSNDQESYGELVSKVIKDLTEQGKQLKPKKGKKQIKKKVDYNVQNNYWRNLK